MRIIFTIFALFIFSGLQAQTKKDKLTGIISVNAGIPTGIFHSVYRFTVGASGGAKYTLSEKSAFTGMAGYIHFFRKGKGEGVSYIPFVGGFQYHFVPKAFVSVDAGGAIPTYSGGGLLGCLIPAAGYQINPRLSIDLNYTGLAQYGLLVGGINLRTIYSFR